MSDISFLPESFRDKEEELKKDSLHEAPEAPVSMHVPEAEEEDVEIIEVDAAEVDEMLMGEPLYSRLYYKLSLWVDSFKEKYLKARPAEPPPKLPPQFFSPPKTAQSKPSDTKATAQPAKTGTAAKTPPTPVASIKPAKAKIVPSGSKGRRVRIIKRVRKPVHVSLLDDEVMRQLRVNIPKRKFTLVFLIVLFALVFGGTYFLLDKAEAQASAEFHAVDQNYKKLKSEIAVQQDKWQTFQDLEPRLIVLNDLLDNHISVLTLLRFLEKNTLKEVSYGNFLIDNTGKLSLTVQASSISVAARQLKILNESDVISKAEASSFTIKSGQDQGVNFQILIQLKPEALRFTSTSTQP